MGWDVQNGVWYGEDEWLCERILVDIERLELWNWCLTVVTKAYGA